MGTRRALELLLDLVALASFWEAQRSYACCRFLSLLVGKVRQVDEVPPFVCLQCLKMGRQGKYFGVNVLTHMQRWWRFPWIICMEFFRSVENSTVSATCLYEVWYA